MTKLKIRIVIASLFAGALIFFEMVQARAAEVVDKECAILTRFENGSQVIPPHGAVITRFKEEMPLACGSMVYTYKNVMNFKHVSLTQVKLGTESFFEVSKAKSNEAENSFYLYRGKVLVSAVPNKKMVYIHTPNARIDFQGGLALIQYDPAKKLTTVASFSSKFEFRNKFNLAATQTVNSGEMSTLGVSGQRVVPSQPEVMSGFSVKEVLISFHLPAPEKEEMIRVVESAYETRSNELLSDIEEWNDFEQAEEPVRAPASTAAKSVKKIQAIDPVEANFTVQMMKKHLYGGEEGVKMIQENHSARKPASESIQDPERERIKKKQQKEVDEVLKGISNL